MIAEYFATEYTLQYGALLIRNAKLNGISALMLIPEQALCPAENGIIANLTILERISVMGIAVRNESKRRLGP